MNREVDLLLSAATTRLDPERKNRIAGLIQERIDWNYLLWLAHPHQMIPLLYWNLNSIDQEFIPAPYLEYLRNYFKKNSYQNLFILSELCRIINLFNQSKIPVLCYQEPMMVYSIYKNPALRESEDIDILIHKHNLSRAKDLLLSSGYKPYYPLTRAKELTYIHSNGEYTFAHTRFPLHINLQWEVVPQFYFSRIDPEYFWKDLKQVRMAETPIQTLSPEKLLFLLCMKAVGLKPCWGQLRLITEISEITFSQKNLNWDELCEMAQRFGVKKVLFATLIWAKNLLGTDIPKALFQKMQKEQSAKSLSTYLCQQLTRGNVASPFIKERHLLFLKLRERAKDTIGYWLRKHKVENRKAWLPIPQRLSNYVQTPKEIAEQMLLLAEVKPKDVVYDLGAGDGRIVIMAAKQFGARSVGIEIRSDLIQEAKANARKEGVEHLVSFVQKDIMQTDLSPASVVVSYLFHSSCYKLLPKLQRELKRGVRIVSHDNYMGSWLPRKIKWLLSNNMNNVCFNYIFLWRVGEDAPPLLNEWVRWGTR